MKKMFLAACLTLAVCAAFAPAASASPFLTEGGIPIASGATVTAQSEGQIVRTNAFGNYTCHQSDMHGTVVKNSGSSIEIEFASVTYKGATGGGCDYPGGTETWQAGNLPWCLKIGTAPVDGFTMTGGKCGEAPKAITMTISRTMIHCPTFSNASGATGTYKTKTPGVGLSFAAQSFTGGSGFPCSNFVLDPVQYNLTTAASPFTALTIS